MKKPTSRIRLGDHRRRRRRRRRRSFLLMSSSWLLPHILTVGGIVTAAAAAAAAARPYQYHVGVGRHDMTGPASQINFMGYAKAGQTGHGIHLRLWSRAFIVSEAIEDRDETGSPQGETSLLRRPDEDVPKRSIFSRFFNLDSSHHVRTKTTRPHDPPPSILSQLDPNRTVCFVSADMGMGSDLVTQHVLQRLEQLLPQQQSTHGNNDRRRLCHRDNLSISGTHTHSANAGFLQYALYQVTSRGFVRDVFDTYVESIAQSIRQAYLRLDRTTVVLSRSSEFLRDANINRSPTSYLLNPQWERDRYDAEGDTDKTMVQLSFWRNHDPVGLLNWFAVHGTSMNGTNTLLSGDNKGYASYVMERQHHDGSMQAPFVAAFASTNLGDVSPNTAGPRCLDTGAPCDVLHSTCGGRNELCVASGPGSNMQESTEIIGRRQYEVAQALLENAMNGDRLLQGPVAFRHAFVDMAHRNVTVDNVTVHTCPAALGYGFAAGTTDGPGMFDFSQGQNSTNPFWNIVSRFLSVPSQAQIDCHHPKPILLNTGEATLPYAWDPQSVPISIFRIGNFYLLNVPAELTTMAGRRLRRAVEAVIVQHRPKEERPQVTIAGLANSYTHYVTTQEEYAGQRYEAASTLYGPHTLAAYIQEFERLTRDLLLDRPSRSDDPPDDLLKHQLSLIPPAMADTIGIGKKFGSVARDVEQDVYDKGDTVHVSFRSANPRHNPRIGGTFLTVDRWMDDDSWQTMYVDGDWCTKYVWNSPQLELGISFAEMYWDIPDEAPAGQYRMCHYGTRKTWVGAYLEGWSLQYVPDCAYMDNLLGSMAAGWLWRLLRFLATVVEPVGDTIQQILEMGRLKDFEGCSKTFQVR